MRAQKLFCFGHRGACGHEPENTVRSVRRALELGADGVEVDVYFVDGQLVVIHDDTLDRTTNGRGRVDKKSFAELRALDAGRGEKIPTLAEIFEAVNRRAVFASGSPFAPVTIAGKTLVPGQGNNAYIFPGIGLGVVGTAARRVTDAMFIRAARTLASLVRGDELAEGRVYPSLNRIREVSLAIAVAVAGEVYAKNLNRLPRPADLTAHIRAQMFKPEYLNYCKG